MRHLHRFIAAFLLLIPVSATQAFEIGVYQTGDIIYSMSGAIDAISNGDLVGSASYSTINFKDSDPWQGSGHFGDDVTPFPGGAESDFALLATGMIYIDSAGEWTFGVQHDDGVRLLIDGILVIDYPDPTDDRDTFGTISLSTGMHELELIFYERQGGSAVELFSAYGNFDSFNSGFALTESVEPGSSDVPVPAPLALIVLGAVALLHRRLAH